MIFRLQIIGNNELIIDKYIYFGENTPDSEKKVIKSI